MIRMQIGLNFLQQDCIIEKNLRDTKPSIGSSFFCKGVWKCSESFKCGIKFNCADGRKDN